MRSPTALELARFMDKVEKVEGGCWLWTGALVRNESKDGTRQYRVSGGYGMFSFDGRLGRTHRLAYQWWVGEIPPGMTVEHACHTSDQSCRGGQDCLHRRCVNPDHLALLSRRANVLAGNTITAANVLKTHCPKGHAYEGSNLGINAAGGRYCRECARTKAVAAYRKKHPEAKVRGPYRRKSQ